MPHKEGRPPDMAFENSRFLKRRAARPLRILAEYLEPQARFASQSVVDTIVFMGSARIVSREQAEAACEAASCDRDERHSKLQLEMSQYYEDASDLAEQLTTWSKNLNDEDHRYVVCTGGGPGIMEAANRGASRAKGMNIGMAISIPDEQIFNPHITRELSFRFHYFFMRKFWFAYLAKAVVFFPGGFGTLDEMFELLTLLKTGKVSKHLPVVLFGKEYWSDVLNFDALVRYGTIDPEDLDYFIVTDSVEESFDYITKELSKALPEKGTRL